MWSARERGARGDSKAFGLRVLEGRSCHLLRRGDGGGAGAGVWSLLFRALPAAYGSGDCGRHLERLGLEFGVQGRGPG